MSWDPDQYLRYSEERALPFRHLIAALDHLHPATIVDLGCGPGGLTATLLERWPDAHITGIDNSLEMIRHASRRQIEGRLIFEVGDVTNWRSPQPIDIMLSNACIHWIDDHQVLFDHLLPQLATGGTLAFQVPANHEAPSHTILRKLCSSRRWRNRLEGLPRTGVQSPGWYQRFFGERGFKCTVWQTTYHHLLEGADPVLEWMRGTTLRPILERIPRAEQKDFCDQYGERIRAAYPERDEKTVFPFTRIFVVAIRS